MTTTTFAVRIENATEKDIAKLEEMYAVDRFWSAIYIQYPTESSATKGVSRIARRFGLDGIVAQVQTRYENIVGIV